MLSRTLIFDGPDQPFRDVQLPIPELQTSELLVKVTCCTLCRSDLHTRRGRRTEPTPTVLGHEIVGTVQAFGPTASHTDARGTPLREGTRVSWAIAVGCGQCANCARDLPQKCLFPAKYGHRAITPTNAPLGGLAEYIVLVPNTVVYAVPDNLTDPVAATANCATATVAAILKAAGPVPPVVVVLGVGVLGLTACAMAATCGANTVIAFDKNPENQARALSFGATHTTNDLKAISELAPEGADLVIELAGALETAQATFDLVRTSGTIIFAGTVTPLGSLNLEPQTLVRRLLTLRGVHNYHPDDLGTALDFLSGPGKAYPFESLISQSFSLSQIDEAFAHADQNIGTRAAVIP